MNWGRALGVALAVLFGASACGGLEIPSQPGGRASSMAPTSSSGSSGSALVFVNASAVVVGPGDTVYGLSRRHRVSARDIIVANNLRPPYQLIVGQRIVLPRGTEHTVRAGETLYRIAKSYDATVYEIARANAIGPPYTIFVDQKLRIPGTVVVRATAAGSGSSASSASSATHETSAVTTPSTIPAPPPKSVPTPPPSSGSGFIWPANGKVISSFGPKNQGLHNDGINIAGNEGDAVLAAENGVVAYAGNELRGFGNLILVKHANGYVTAYAHASELLVRRGDKVSRGQAIARLGATGNVSSPQLHFEVRKGKKPLDPQIHLPSRSA